VLDATGQFGALNYRWKRLSAHSPRFSDAVCREGYEQLSSVFCTRPGQATQGGTVRIGGDSGYEIGIDPDDMKGFHTVDGRYSNVGKFIDAFSTSGVR